MRLQNVLPIVIGKIVSSASKLFHLGAGATWPGEIALRLSPNIFAEFASQLRKGIILVAGTNGKTTTSLMITQVLEKQGLTVVHNASGANLLNGIVSACIQKAAWSGKLRVDYGVFEVDENSLPQIIFYVNNSHSREPFEAQDRRGNPENDKTGSPIGSGMTRQIVLVLLNLFRDQLDRYGELDVIAEKWKKALLRLDTGNQTIKPYQLIANADDPLIVHLASSASRAGLEARVTYFGLNDASQFQKKMEHATDSTFCPACGARLIYEGYYYSHIGVWKCEKCKAKRPTLDVSDWDYPLPGLYNRYNTLAAVTTSQALGIKKETIKKALLSFKPAFGRQEELVVNGKRVKLFLSKNPAGFNESLRTVIQLGAKQILFVLNDRIPDGRDVSWIWDVDFEMIPGNISVAVSGDRVYDLALRLKYAGITANICENLENAFDTKETLYVLPTYSAMLDVRKILTGKKIL